MVWQGAEGGACMIWHATNQGTWGVAPMGVV